MKRVLKRKKLKRLRKNEMARPKKFPTKVVRIRTNDLDRLRKLAKITKLSIPDYINLKLKL
jgi:hypothetical protein